MQELETKMEDIRAKVRKGLIRAHRTGELHELRGELDELADAVPTLESRDYAGATSWASPMGVESTRKAWGEMTSSDSDGDPRFPIGRRDEPTSDSASEREANESDAKQKVRKGLIRAHRTGELQELRGELDELADVVPTLATLASSSAP